MKKLIITLMAFFVSAIAIAQTTPLIVQEQGTNLFLNHTVAPKENWYAIGRLYNISPKDIASYNGTTIDKGLSVGQSIKIPLVSANFIQGSQRASDEALVPVYHVVKEKEGLYRIGQQFNKVSADQLRAWNKLPSNDISNGMKLIVGYLKVKKDLSPLAKAAQTPTDVAVTKQEVALAPNKELKKESPVAASTVAAEKAAEEKKDDKAYAANKNEPKAVVTSGTAVQENAGGVFKNLFNEQTTGKSNSTQTSGTAAVFKSTSGWKDYKYYALMNNVTAGTVVKINNPANNRVVYAKVLGELPPGQRQ
jgi:LysM repeat protein